MRRSSYTSSSRNQRSRRSISIAVGHYLLTTIVVIAILILITLALVSTEVHSFSFSSAQSMKRAFFAPSSSRFIIRGVSNNAVVKSSEGLNLAVHVEHPAKDSHYLQSRCFYPKRSPSALSTRLFGSSIDNTNSNNMSTNNNMNEKNHPSASALTEQLAIRLIQGDELQTDTSNLKPTKACIAIAGGGSNAASAIASTPGASSLLLESIVTYDRKSYAEFVSQNVGDDIGLLNDLESIFVGGRGTAADSAASGESSAASSKSSGDSSSHVFQFSSTEAAILLSRSALNRSLQLTPSFQDQSLHCIGVGCTSSLVGKTSPDGDVINGRMGRRSRAYIAISTLREGTVVWEVRLDGNNDKKTNGGVRRRSRSEEEAVISNLLLSAMIQYRKGSTGLSKDVSQILNRDGDSIERTLLDGGSFKEGGKSPAAGASQIINGNAGAVVVLPVAQQHSNAEQPGEHQQMEAIFSDSGIPFPRDILIVPGSFNPPHQGHVGLANAAVAALRRLRQRDSVGNGNGNNNDAINTPSSRSYSRYSSLSSVSSSSSSILKNLWDTVDQYSEEQYDPTVFFEMSVTNADKPPLDPSEVDRRVGMFTSILPTSEMPKDWGVILTNAPLFSQKTSTLDELIPRSFDGNHTSRRMSFVLGTDTMVRIINQKYYGNNRDNMIAALVDMQKKGVHFIVGGRLEQGTDNTSKFVNGEEEVKSLPPGVQKMFTLLTEDEFRLDISSTELRKRLEESTHN